MNQYKSFSSIRFIPYFYCSANSIFVMKRCNTWKFNWLPHPQVRGKITYWYASLYFIRGIFLRLLFWAFYDASLAPTIEVGLSWPPKGVMPLSVYSVPLLNTVILLTRGITVTWAHHSIINNFFNKSVVSLVATVALGAYFMLMQYVEYCEARFAMADGVYGSTFFMATGFHGFHVTVGTLFLLYVLIALLRGQMLYNHHFAFEAAAWYWHFVDVVWLFLFINIYWWGRL